MQTAKLLLVEDERNFGIVMRDYLQMNGFEVVWCEDGLTGLSKFETEPFNLCIIDVMMPKMDGFVLVEEIRRRNDTIPLVFLTARSLREDMLKGYRLGADDYIVKPFDTEVLILKINALLKRSGEQLMPDTATIVKLSTFQLNYPLRELTHRSGSGYKLSPKEAELLYLLALKQNTVVPKSVLLKKIWKEDNYFTGRSMDVYLTKLRKYLEADPDITIENIHGNGYCLRCTNVEKPS